MKRKLSFLLLIFTLLVFLFSTTGISLYKHHCYTSDQTYFGFLKPAECDHLHSHHKTGNDCCHRDVSSDPKTPEVCGNCCSDEHLYVKSNIDAIVPAFSESNLVPLFPEHLNTLFSIIPEDNITQVIFFSYRPKPPPKTGSFITILYHSLKIPDFLS